MVFTHGGEHYRIISLRPARPKKSGPMHVTSKSGRVFRVPSAAEDARIVAGIAADPDASDPITLSVRYLYRSSSGNNSSNESTPAR